MSKDIHSKESRIILTLLYQDSLEADENPHPEELDSGNEADTKPENMSVSEK